MSDKDKSVRENLKKWGVSPKDPGSGVRNQGVGPKTTNNDSTPPAGGSGAPKKK